MSRLDANGRKHRAAEPSVAGICGQTLHRIELDPELSMDM